MPSPAERAFAAASTVVDPELPMVTLVDLGVLRSVEVAEERVVVTLTPTYTGCPALATMRADLRLALARAGFPEVELRTELSPPWSSDSITENGRAALSAHGMAPPSPVGARRPAGPVDVLLLEAPPTPACPRCGSFGTRELSRYGASPCTSLHVCTACLEPFEKVKEL